MNAHRDSVGAVEKLCTSLGKGAVRTLEMPYRNSQVGRAGQQQRGVETLGTPTETLCLPPSREMPGPGFCGGFCHRAPSAPQDVPPGAMVRAVPTMASARDKGPTNRECGKAHERSGTIRVRSLETAKVRWKTRLTPSSPQLRGLLLLHLPPQTFNLATA